MKHRFSLPVLAFFLVLPVLLCAGLARAQTAAQPPLPDALKAMTGNGAQVRYLGREMGLDGWATILQGREQYFYVTQDGEAILMGLLFDKSGRPVTIEQVAKLQQSEGDTLDQLAADTDAATDPIAQIQERLKAQQAQTPTQKLMQDVESASAITLGANPDAPVVYAFMDPQCPHCHALMGDLRKDLLPTGQIQVKLIAVGTREDTKEQAAFLLAAPDAEDRWYRHLDGDADALPADPSVNKQAVEKNLMIMQNWKFDATPMVVYKDKAGAVKIVKGRPRDLSVIVNDLY